MSSIDQEIWDISTLGWRIAVNSKFNSEWINSNSLSAPIKSIDDLHLEGLDVSDSHPHEVGWLKNIDRLVDMLPLSFDPSEFDLLDVGCGSGISTLYFCENYCFSSFSGIDLSPILIASAVRNLQIFNNKKKSTYKIVFAASDAREYVIDNLNRKIFIYMFNPFGFDTASVFVARNLETLRSRNAILALSWDTWIWQLLAKKWHKAVVRNSLYKLSLVAF